MALLPFPGSQSETPRTSSVEDDGLLGKISVLERLDELRKRLVYSSLAVALGVLTSLAFVDRIVNFLLAPTRQALPSGNKLIYTQPGEAFSLYIYVSLIAGVVVAMPFVMYQVWRLIAPLVGPSARRFAIPFVLMSTGGFVAGAAFNHFVVFAWMMAFFASFNTPDLVFMPRLDDVFDLYAKMLLGMGAVFQMPTVVFFLAKVGLVTPGLLWRNFRFAILLIFIAAAVITPTGDMVTQTIFAAPMVGLYLLSIFVAWIFGRAKSEPPAEP